MDETREEDIKRGRLIRSTMNGGLDEIRNKVKEKIKDLSDDPTHEEVVSVLGDAAFIYERISQFQDDNTLSGAGLVVKIATLYIIDGPESAFNLLKEIEKNNPQAKVHMALGDMYYYGLGTDEDLDVAKDYYDIAVKNNETELSLAELLQNEYTWIAQTFHNKLGNMDKVIYFYKKAFSVGSIDAALRVAELYTDEYGFGPLLSRAYALENYIKAANQGKRDMQFKPYFDRNKIAVANYNLGYMYTNLEKVDSQSNVLAMQSYMKAAELGMAEGYYGVGFLYYNGLGVEKDEEKAIEWITKAKELGSEDAIDFLTRHDNKGGEQR